MKKLAVLLIMVLVVINTYGQKSGAFGMIFNSPEHATLFKYFIDRNCVHTLNAYISGSDHSTIEYYENHINYVKNSYYSFVENGKLYVLSYGDVRITEHWTNSINSIERDLLLFCWDGTKWIVVIDEPIQTDTYKYFGDEYNGYWVLKNYYPKLCHDGITPEYGQKVEKKENGDIKIILASSEYITSKMNWSNIYIETIVLESNNDGTYHLKNKSGKKQIESKF
ncbi:MAG: hypothetical protein WC333_00455 [Dehalococcoidia bacterium]|jgi:hypothetical protein